MIHRDKPVPVFPLGLRSTVSDQAGVSTGRQPGLGHTGETPGRQRHLPSARRPVPGAARARAGRGLLQSPGGSGDHRLITSLHGGEVGGPRGPGHSQQQLPGLSDPSPQTRNPCLSFPTAIENLNPIPGLLSAAPGPRGVASAPPQGAGCAGRRPHSGGSPALGAGAGGGGEGHSRRCSSG